MSLTQKNDSKHPRPKIRYRKAISNIALVNMRYYTCLRETALTDGGLITPDDVYLVIDHNKVRRAQEKLVSNLEEEFDKRITENGINCLFLIGEGTTQKCS